MKCFQKFSFAFYLFSVVIAACSDVRLEKTEPSVVMETKLPEGSFCSKFADLGSSQLKVAFIVDMSLSNIGEFHDEGNGRVKFLRTNATDSDGARFNKIRDFINGCGSNNAANRFKVIGFSGSAMKTNPALSGCQGGFFDKSRALNALSSLRGIQDYNKANVDYNDFAPSMQTTTYNDGLECARSLVLDDIQQSPDNAKNSNYMVFFVTDGKASDNCRENSVAGEFRDSYGTCCPGGSIRAQGQCCAPGVLATWLAPATGGQYCCAVGDRRSDTGTCERDPNFTDAVKAATNPQYETTIRDIMLAGRAKASSVRLQPLYYGPSAESSDALTLLDQFANLGDSPKTIQLTNINEADFCKYANSAVKTQHQVAEFNVINLTAMMRKGKLVADSDIDGVPDVEDAQPSNSRGNAAGLLDGLCLLAAGDMSCERPSRCDGAKISTMHLSECDLASLSLADHDGLDSDKDRIPDFIEVLRGTLPNVNDAFSNLDGDQMTNIDEIRMGRQVGYPDDDLEKNKQMNWSISRLPATLQCPSNQQNYKISLNRIPLVSTKVYEDYFDFRAGPSQMPLSHKENENVVLIYYITEPLNNKSAASEIFGTTIRVSASESSHEAIKIEASQFKKLGSLDGKPQW